MALPLHKETEEQHYLQAELEAGLLSELNLWTFLQQNGLDGVWYWDLENPEHEWLSPEFWELLGYDPDEKQHLAKEWQDLIFEEDLQLAEENFRRHCADPSFPYSQDVRYRHRDGSTVWVRCRGVAIRDKSGKPIRMLGVHSDLTSIKRAQADALLRQSEKILESKARREAESANADLTSFAFSISHDLKSPTYTLMMLLSELEHVSKSSLTEEQAELLSHANHTLARMQSLVEGLLEYAQMIGQTPTLSPVDTNQVVAGVLEDLRADIKSAKAEVSYNELPTVPGNETQLRVMLQNLISNAIKYRDPERPMKIEIAGMENDHAFVIDIWDTGQGVPKSKRQKIFLPFARLHRFEDIEGHGLGLAICRRIANNHNGDIMVSERPGGGSCFTVRIMKERL